MIPFLRRRFYEFRLGYTIYLGLLVGSINFTLIVYRMFIEEVPLLQGVFPTILSFVILMIVVLPPAGMLVGRYHRKYQLRTDQGILTEVHPGFQQINEKLDRIERKIDEHF